MPNLVDVALISALAGSGLTTSYLIFKHKANEGPAFVLGILSLAAWGVMMSRCLGGFMTADTWIRVCAVSLCLMLFGLSYYRIRQGKKARRW